MSTSPARRPDPGHATSSARYAVIVPVKPPARAKSRLSLLGDPARRSLTRAFVADTVTAALACPGVDLVLAITDDHHLAADLRRLGAAVIPDGSTVDLNASLVQGAQEVRRRDPTLRIAAVCADLPALRSGELDRALSQAPADRMSFVPDADGVGTTVVLAPDADSFRPRFGERSRREHLDHGASEIGLDLASVRRDVDTPGDLEQALRLGVGRRTSATVGGEPS